jgi:hypothetical protein
MCLGRNGSVMGRFWVGQNTDNQYIKCQRPSYPEQE